jgi:hypothetical protein
MAATMNEQPIMPVQPDAPVPATPAVRASKPPRDRGRLPRRGRVEVVTAAAPDSVWQVVSDISRTGEWSHECAGGEWLAGATSAAPGARFRARNRHGRMAWQRVNEVVVADAPRQLSWQTVSSRLYPDSTRWTVDLEPVEGGTRIVQSFEVLKLLRFFDWLYAHTIPAHRDRTEALTQDLRNLAAVAERVRFDP